MVFGHLDLFKYKRMDTTGDEHLIQVNIGTILPSVMMAYLFYFLSTPVYYPIA